MRAAESSAARTKGLSMTLGRTTTAAAIGLIAAACFLGPKGLRAQDSVAGEPVTILIDNDDADGITLVGDWVVLDGANDRCHGPDFLHDANQAKGAMSVHYTPTFPADGHYLVAMYWPKHANRATQVPIEIITADGNVPKTLNQRGMGDKWEPLGVFRFAAGKRDTIIIRNHALDGHVVADAVRFIPLTLIEMDNSDPGVQVQGDWQTESGEGHQGADFLVSYQPGAEDASVTYTLDIPEPDSYEVFVWSVRADNRGTVVPVDVEHMLGTETVYIDQRNYGHGWLRLGVFPFDEDGLVRFRMRSANGPGAADAVRLVAVSGDYLKMVRQDFDPAQPLPRGLAPRTFINILLKDGSSYPVLLVGFNEPHLLVLAEQNLIGVAYDTIDPECLYKLYRQFIDPKNPAARRALAEFCFANGLDDLGKSEQRRAEMLEAVGN